MLIFLDTEFTNLVDPRLISIGLVSETGQKIYLESSDYVLSDCSEFVHEMVLPQLSGSSEVLCNADALKSRLTKWFAEFEDTGGVIVLYDYEGDWNLLCKALEWEIPGWVSNANIYAQLNELVLEQFFIDSGLQRHHALNDAIANKFAYRPV